MINDLREDGGSLIDVVGVRKMSEPELGVWQPISTAPIGKTILMWWRPSADPERFPHPSEAASDLSDNRYAEACVIGQLSGYEEGKWWNGQRGEYQDLWHVTHWMPLPGGPK
jgi:hypothetical protein